MPNPLDKVINLIKKTGDNAIILDTVGEPQYVVMSFDKYQSLIDSGKNLAGLTEKELLEKINEDVSSWKQSVSDLPKSNETVDMTGLDDRKNSPTFPQNDSVNIPEPVENSLNEAENSDESDHGGEKYYFEPID